MEPEKPLDHNDSRERILDEAKALFAARGYRGLSMREIAEAVGISKAGIYYHFRDKEELFAAMLHRYLLQLADLIAAPQAGGSARRQLEETVRVILRQPAQDRSLVRMASQEIAHLSEPARRRFDAAYDELFVGRLRALIVAGIEHSELRPVDPQTATWALLGMMYPYFTPAGPGQASFPPDSVVDDLLAIYFDGLSRSGNTTE